MLIVESYALAVVLCVVTMICWGSWATVEHPARRGNRHCGNGGGLPDRGRVEIDDPRWVWKGGWSVQAGKNASSPSQAREAGGAGDEVTLTFEGTGVALVGTMSQQGGRADVWLDGKRAGEIDAWIPERTSDNDYWHATGLRAGRHVVRIVVRGDADARSTCRRVRIERAITYGTGEAAR